MGSAITSDEQNSQTSSDSGGTLTEDALSNITDDTERVRAAFKTPGGLTRIAGETERQVAYTAVMVVTDRRVLFMADPASSADTGENSHSIPYADIGAVSVVGDDRNVLALSTARGKRWEFPLPETDPETVGAVVRHLRWVGELRSRLVTAKNDVQLAAGEIRENASEMNWEDAESTYEDMRERVDQLVQAVQWTKPIDNSVIAPELTDIERTLERSYAWLFVERAHSQLELSTQLVENEDYSQAQKVLRSVQEYYERARERADAVERGDAFRFGEQRELREELDRLGWEIEAIAAEPVRQAHEARILAANADDPETAVDHWETAFRRYGSVLSLSWGDEDRYFPGEREERQTDMATVGDRLVECHRELARDMWEAGIQDEQEGAVKEAIEACDRAIEHLERAEELATEFRPEDASDIADRRQRMERAVEGMRETATVDRQSGPQDDTAPAGDRTDHPTAVTDGDTREGAEEDLLDIDTHQEITLNMTIDEQAEVPADETDLSADPDDLDLPAPETPVDPDATNGK